MTIRVLSGLQEFSIRKIIAAMLIFLGALASTVLAGDTEYKYDALGRLVEVDHISDGKVVQFCYDDAGNRTSKIVGSASVACGSTGGGGGPPITIANGLTVLPEHTAFYSCRRDNFYGTIVDRCFVLGSNTTVYTQVNSDPPQYETGYSGTLVVEQAYYNTP
ncbi:MAG: RHS repeat protein [Woeseiaceae bacterium]|nr:RHS repeat protein [Woeseiaceae bacterium]